jgi:hypothetical protein
MYFCTEVHFKNVFIMSKSINVHEACIITKDDKGNLSMVGKAKEALTSLQKNKVSVHILLCQSKKEDVEKFLNDNNVPFASILTKEEAKEENSDKKAETPVTVVPSSQFVTLDGDWQWCLDRIVQRLWGEKKKEAPKSEQARMDEAMQNYIEWTKPKKAANGSIMNG